jgi:hypothetical protein
MTDAATKLQEVVRNDYHVFGNRPFTDMKRIDNSNVAKVF